MTETRRKDLANDPRKKKKSGPPPRFQTAVQATNFPFRIQFSNQNIESQSLNMPKRKLSEFNGPASSDTRKLSMKAARLTFKFEQSVQIIIKGMKTARGFERQKLSRREKAARKPYDSVTLAKLSEEVEALKVRIKSTSRLEITKFRTLTSIAR